MKARDRQRQQKKQASRGAAKHLQKAPKGAFQRYRGVLALVLIVVCMSVTHGAKVPATFHHHHWEDVQFIKYVQEYIHSYPECFTGPPLYPGLYRPLTTSFYYYAGMHAFGPRVEPLKIINMFVFVTNAFLLFLIACRLLPYWWALGAALLFATRQSHLDLVLVTVEAQSLFATLYCLLAFYFLMRSERSDRLGWEIGSYVAFVLAMFCKEPAVAFAGVFLVYGWFFGDRKRWRPYVVHALLAILWVVLFFTVFRGIRDHQPTEFRYAFTLRELLRNAIGHMFTFVNVLVPPVTDVSMRFGDRITAIANSRVVQVGLFFDTVIIVAASILHRRLPAAVASHARVVAFAFLWFLLSMAPYLILKDRLFLRYSYAGHLAVAVLAVALVRAIVAGVQHWRSQGTA